MRKQVKNSKPVANLPYLVPLTDAEIDNLELDHIWQQTLETAKFPRDLRAEAMEDWFWILGDKYFILHNFYRPRARLHLPADTGSEGQMCWINEYRHYQSSRNEQRYSAWIDDISSSSQAWLEELSAKHTEEQCRRAEEMSLEAALRRMMAGHHDPERDMMRSLPLRGLPSNTRREVIQLYC